MFSCFLLSFIKVSLSFFFLGMRFFFSFLVGVYLGAQMDSMTHWVCFSFVDVGMYPSTVLYGIMFLKVGVLTLDIRHMSSKFVYASEL